MAMRLQNPGYRLLVTMALEYCEHHPETDTEVDLILDQLVAMGEQRRLRDQFELVQEEIKRRKREYPTLAPVPPLLLRDGSPAA